LDWANPALINASDPQPTANSCFCIVRPLFGKPALRASRL
jgi:hypothetical protein